MIRSCIALLLLLASQSAFSADNPDIRVLMTAEEFAAAGLDRLSDDQLDAINSWLVRYTAQDAEEMLKNSPAVIELDNEDIRSQIDGQFNGWNGPTRFTLKNGQIWETRSTRRYEYSAIDPEVVITTNWMGISRMRIVGTGQAINVRRVQ